MHSPSLAQSLVTHITPNALPLFHTVTPSPPSQCTPPPSHIHSLTSLPMHSPPSHIHSLTSLPMHSPLHTQSPTPSPHSQCNPLPHAHTVTSHSPHSRWTPPPSHNYSLTPLTIHSPLLTQLHTHSPLSSCPSLPRTVSQPFIIIVSPPSPPHTDLPPTVLSALNHLLFSVFFNWDNHGGFYL